MQASAGSAAYCCGRLKRRGGGSINVHCCRVFKIYRQLFREGLSEKVHPTIPKGIVGGFDCCSKKFERMAGEAMDVCLRVLKESNKSSEVRQLQCQEQCIAIDHSPCYLLGLLRAHFFRQPFSK